MAKYGLYSKNNLKELISIFETNFSHSLRYKIGEDELAHNYFKTIKNLPIEEFDKLFIVKKLLCNGNNK